MTSPNQPKPEDTTTVYSDVYTAGSAFGQDLRKSSDEATELAVRNLLTSQTASPFENALANLGGLVESIIGTVADFIGRLLNGAVDLGTTIWNATVGAAGNFLVYVFRSLGNLFRRRRGEDPEPLPPVYSEIETDIEAATQPMLDAVDEAHDTATEAIENVSALQEDMNRELERVDASLEESDNLIRAVEAHGQDTARRAEEISREASAALAKAEQGIADTKTVNDKLPDINNEIATLGTDLGKVSGDLDASVQALLALDTRLTKAADDAQATADAAHIEAEKKADEARIAAENYAKEKSEADVAAAEVRAAAEAARVAKAEADAAKAAAATDAANKVAAAQTALKAYTDAEAKKAKEGAEASAALDASKKANKAKEDAEAEAKRLSDLAAAAAATAQATADQAKADAESKATAAREAAELYAKEKSEADAAQALADAKAEAARVAQEAAEQAVLESASDADAKVALAESALKAYAEAQAAAAKEGAEAAAALDATTKANKAKADAEANAKKLSDAAAAKATAAQATADQAKLDATNKAAAAQTAAQNYAKEKAEAERAVAEKNAAAEALRVAKAEATAAKNAAATDAKAKADEAERLAKVYADAQAKLAKEQAEATAAADATAKANKAKADAEANAKKLSDKAQKLAEEVKATADTTAGKIPGMQDAITTAHGKAEEAQRNLDNLQIGGRNLVQNSKLNLAETSYNMTSAAFGQTLRLPADNPLVDGEEVTISIKGRLGEGKSSFAVYNSGGSYNLGTLNETHLGADGVYRRTVAWRGASNTSNSYINIYHTPSGVTAESTIEWFKIERGSKATDWSPAPEDVDAGIYAAQQGAGQALTLGEALANPGADITPRLENGDPTWTEGKVPSSLRPPGAPAGGKGWHTQHFDDPGTWEHAPGVIYDVSFWIQHYIGDSGSISSHIRDQQGRTAHSETVNLAAGRTEFDGSSGSWNGVETLGDWRFVSWRFKIKDDPTIERLYFRLATNGGDNAFRVYDFKIRSSTPLSIDLHRMQSEAELAQAEINALNTKADDLTTGLANAATQEQYNQLNTRLWGGQGELNKINSLLWEGQNSVNNRQAAWNKAATDSLTALNNYTKINNDLWGAQGEFNRISTEFQKTSGEIDKAQNEAIKANTDLARLAFPHLDMTPRYSSGAAVWPSGQAGVTTVGTRQISTGATPAYKMTASASGASNASDAAYFTPAEGMDLRVRFGVYVLAEASSTGTSFRLYNRGGTEQIEAVKILGTGRVGSVEAVEAPEWESAARLHYSAPSKGAWYEVDAVVRLKPGSGEVRVGFNTNANSEINFAGPHIGAYFPLQSEVDFAQNEAIRGLLSAQEAQDKINDEQKRSSTALQVAQEEFSEALATVREMVPRVLLSQGVSRNTPPLRDGERLEFDYSNSQTVYVRALGTWTGTIALTATYKARSDERATTMSTEHTVHKIEPGSSRNISVTRGSFSTGDLIALRADYYVKRGVLERSSSSFSNQVAAVYNSWKLLSSFPSEMEEITNHSVRLWAGWENAHRDSTYYHLAITRRPKGSTGFGTAVANYKARLGPTWPWGNGYTTQTLNWSGDLAPDEELAFWASVERTASGAPTTMQRTIRDGERIVSWVN